jgi:hypothetical protein
MLGGCLVHRADHWPPQVAPSSGQHLLNAETLCIDLYLLYPSLQLRAVPQTASLRISHAIALLNRIGHAYITTADS